MSRQTRYSPEVRERAIRMVFEHQGERNGPRILDTAISGILAPFQAARRGADWVKYTPSGVRRSRALWRRLAL